MCLWKRIRLLPSVAFVRRRRVGYTVARAAAGRNLVSNILSVLKNPPGALVQQHFAEGPGYSIPG